jgi:hypothetical protein
MNEQRYIDTYESMCEQIYVRMNVYEQKYTLMNERTYKSRCE